MSRPRTPADLPPPPGVALRSVLEGLPAAISFCAGDEPVLVWQNHACVGRCGDKLGHRLADLLPELLPGVTMADVEGVRSTGTPWTSEGRRVRGPEGDLWYDVRIHPWDEDGVRRGVWLHVLDVTGRVAAWRTAEAERANLFRLFEQAPASIAIRRGPEHVGEFVSRDYVKLLGGRPLIGLTLRESVPEAERQLPILDHVYRTGEVVRHDAAHFIRGAADTVRPGDSVWLDMVYQPLRDADDHIVGVMIHSVEVTSQFLARREVEAARARLEALLGSLDAIIWECPVGDVALTFVSGRVEEMFGWPRARWLEPGFWRGLLHPDDRAGLLLDGDRRMVHPDTFTHEYRLRHADGRWIWVQDTVRTLRDPTGAPTLQRGVMVDATARRAAEEERARIQTQLLQSQKLESLGVLAGGIAHDFNNLLTVILGSASLASLRLGDGHPARGAVDDILSTAQRASDLTRQLLAYAGKARTKFQPLDLGAQVAEIVSLLEATLPKKALLHLDLAPDLPAVEADAAQLQQVVMNLVLNAAEALPEQAGNVHVLTRERTVDAADRSRFVAAEAPAPGRYVALTVRDGGIGMDEATQARIFDPFYTTKSTGRGLGLAAVAGIIRTHRGGLRIASKPGQGSEFTVYLPISSKVVPAPPPAEAEATGGRGRVLLTDDEDEVRHTAREMLEHLGYTVVEARDGEECLRMADAWGGLLAAIIVDKSMPVLDGEETVRELLHRGCKVPVVLSSGYPDPRAEAPGDSPYAAFLQKPYTVRQLAAVVGRVVSAAR